VPFDVVVSKILFYQFRNGILSNRDGSQHGALFVAERHRFGEVFRLIDLQPRRVSPKKGK
jgi:hypothetical protein